jgi:hypothetical protein
MYALQNIRVVKSRGMKWLRYAARMGQMRNTYKTLVRKPEGEGPIGRPRRRIYLRETGRENVDWIYLAQFRDQWRAVLNTVMRTRIP